MERPTRVITSLDIGAGRGLELVCAAAGEHRAIQRVIRGWKSLARRRFHPLTRDAIDFAVLAVRRWREAVRAKAAASDLKEFKDFIRDNQQTEVSILILAKAPWLPRGRTVGLCLLRRTWCNNICVHYIARRPSEGEGRPELRGIIGLALIYSATQIAEMINAGAIWGEATQNSRTFYEKILGRPVKDFVFLPVEEYRPLKAALEKKVSACSQTDK